MYILGINAYHGDLFCMLGEEWPTDGRSGGRTVSQNKALGRVSGRFDQILSE